MGHSNNIGYLLQHLAFTLSRQNDQILLERLGIGFSQFKILMVLQRNLYIQQRDIADALGQTEASISRQIKLMLEQGLLHTRISPENRRRHLTVPTAKGERLTEEAIKILNGFHGPLFEQMNDRQQQQLLEILTQMHHSVCSPGKSYACRKPLDL